MTTTNLSEPDPRTDFLAWLALHRGHDTRLGDLADDMHCDRGTPRVESLDALIGYLINRGACSECLRTAKSAWKQWKR